MFSIKYCFENWIQSLPCTHIISSAHVHFAVAGNKGYFVSYFSRCFVCQFIDSVKFCTTWQRSSVKPQFLELEESAKSLQRVFFCDVKWYSKGNAKKQKHVFSLEFSFASSINDVGLSPSRDEDVLEGIKGEFILHHENLEPLTTREDAPGQYDTGSPLFEMNLLILNTFNDQLGFVASLCSPSSSRAE